MPDMPRQGREGPMHFPAGFGCLKLPDGFWDIPIPESEQPQMVMGVPVLTVDIFDGLFQLFLPYFIRKEQIRPAIGFRLMQDAGFQKFAAKAGMSPFHFLRVFSQATGLTPHQYLLSTRIRAARFLLQSTSLSVKRIALDCGFSTEAAFCSTFRKREGRTPSQYRKDALL